MTKKIIKLLGLCCCLGLNFYAGIMLADKFDPNANYQVCFTPGGNCANLIVDTIAQAQQQILVQAYSFTSVPITQALIQAHKRGVEVRIILDKSQYRSHGFSIVKLFADYHLPVWIDQRPSIAHNKVMIIDKKIVITGSFNFTRAAQERNAENVIIINDQQLAQKYLKNWQSRLQQSFSTATFSTF